jgi:protein SCO1
MPAPSGIAPSSRGKAVILTFGYTSCPDACPTTHALLGAAMKLMGDDAERVQGLFVTIDPERDTPQALSRYVTAFHPSFLGLYGGGAALDRVAHEFKIHHHHDAPAADGSYNIDHSSPIYAFDTAGRLRLLIKPEAPPESIAHDVRILMQNAD